jgi:hypothetical protein
LFFNHALVVRGIFCFPGPRPLFLNCAGKSYQPEKFSPRCGHNGIGILVSMMNWMRASVIRAVDGLTQPEFDFLVDPMANTIGVLLMHLATTDTIYQDLAFYNLKDFSEANKKIE